jgi:hypothetical protein
VGHTDVCGRDRPAVWSLVLVTVHCMTGCHAPPCAQSGYAHAPLFATPHMYARAQFMVDSASARHIIGEWSRGRRGGGGEPRVPSGLPFVQVANQPLAGSHLAACPMYDPRCGAPLHTELGSTEVTDYGAGSHSFVFLVRGLPSSKGARRVAAHRHSRNHHLPNLGAPAGHGPACSGFLLTALCVPPSLSLSLSLWP